MADNNYSSIYRFVTNFLYDPELGRLINQYNNPYLYIINTIVEDLQQSMDEVIVDLNDKELVDYYDISDYTESSIDVDMVSADRCVIKVTVVFNDWEHPNFVGSVIYQTVEDNVLGNYPDSTIGYTYMEDESLSYLNLGIYHISFDITFI